MIETYPQLRDWFICHKIPVEVATNPLAMESWERAISDPSLGKIRRYWVMAGMNLYISEEILWGSIAQ